jgi:hypothetical protein
MRGRGLRENMRLLAVVGTAAAAIGYGTTASADTLEWAVVLAYQNNSSLNAQRAALRAVDEKRAAGAVRLSAETQCHCSWRI